LARQAKVKAVKGAAAAARGISVNARQAILEAALKAFARDGFDGASLPRIADMAGIAHPLIHYHFGSKDNLWRETVDFALGDLSRQAAAIRTASRGLSPLDRLRVLVRAFTHFAARCPDHFGLVFAEARSDSERFAWIQDNYTAAFMDSVKAVIEEAQAQKQIRVLPLGNLAFMLMGSMLLYFTFNPTLPKDADIDQLADEHAELLLDIMLNGIAA